MAKKNETITIPMDLARLLAAEKEDYKDSSQFEDGQKVAKAMLKVLMEIK